MRPFDGVKEVLDDTRRLEYRLQLSPTDCTNTIS